MDDLEKNLPHIIGLIILVFALIFLLTNFGYLRPCDLPGFEKIYYGIKGYPQIAIVSGDDGTGNPEALRNAIIERTNLFPIELQSSDLITGGVLDNYQLVIVEHAKTMDSRALSSFRDYVQKGGKLVWIGDAGTKLTNNDYLCDKISFSYLPAVNQEVPQTNENGTIRDEEGNPITTTELICGQWTTPYTPDDPTQLEAGLCDHDFSGLVNKFIQENESYYEQATTGNVYLCPDEDITTEPYQVNGGERILNCIQIIQENTGKAINEITEADVTEYCSYGINYWNRGASESETGKITNPFNFGATVLGADYVGSVKGEQTNLFLNPLTDHLLIRGYSTGVDVTQWFGVTNFTIVDTTGYEFRTSTIMNLRKGTGGNQVTYPAIIFLIFLYLKLIISK